LIAKLATMIHYVTCNSLVSFLF